MKAGFQTSAMSYLLFLRFVPAFPFWAVNLVAAILGVPLKTYVIGTFFGIIPATMAFASLGAGLDSVIAAAEVQHAGLRRRTGRGGVQVLAECEFARHARADSGFRAARLRGAPTGCLQEMENTHGAAK
jgi:TctA family transporter